MNKSHYLTIPDAFTDEMYFAWLIRSDIRSKFPEEQAVSQRYFLLWWLLEGEREYPLCPHAKKSAEFQDAVLFESEAIEPFSYTFLMDYLWRLRLDVQERIPYDATNLKKFLQWFFLYGVPELHLFPYILPSQSQALLAPFPLLQGGAGSRFNYLMAFLWEFEEDVQKQFNPAHPQSLLAFENWFISHGLSGYNLTEYYHPAAPHDVRAKRKTKAVASASVEFSVQSAFPQALSSISGQNASALGINIIGYARGELGTGEDVRMAAEVFRELRVPFSIFNIQAGDRVCQKDAYLDEYITENLPYGINLFCLTGFDTANILLRFGRGLFQDKYNIGYWPWELSRFPDSWEPAYSLVDEIWASTRFAANSYAMTSPKPVLHMPMHVSLSRFQQYPRSAYDLPEDVFLFLFVFDFNSYIHRKNPWACIEAFQKAFPDGQEKVGLVFKVMSVDEDSSQWRRFAERCRQDARIHILSGTYDRDKALGLFGACDAYVSLHRSEGFGRTMAEAMLLQKPVIATGYSGNADFIRNGAACPVKYALTPVNKDEYPFAEGQCWAEPDPEHAAYYMKKLFLDRNYRDEVGLAGKRSIEERYSSAAVGAKYMERLSALLRSGTIR